MATAPGWETGLTLSARPDRNLLLTIIWVTTGLLPVTRANATAETMAHHQRVAGTQTVDERIELREIVAVVSVAHDDEFAVRGADAAKEGAPVPLFRDPHDPSPGVTGKLLGSVGRAVVGDQYLPVDAGPLQKATRLAYAGRNRLGLVEAGHENGQLENARRVRRGGRLRTPRARQRGEGRPES